MATNNVNTLDLDLLGMDQAYIRLTTDSLLYLYGLQDECLKCPFSIIGELNLSKVFKVSTEYGTSWRIYKNNHSSMYKENDKDDLICEVRPRNFGPFGVYDISQSGHNCSIATTTEPSKIFYLPIICVAAVLIFLCVVWNVVTGLKRRSSDSQNDEQPARKRKRLVSLDTFRGICIALMIFVNYNGGSYALLSHATWNGLHMADLLFPWFMWIMGVCIPISVNSQLNKKVSRFKIFTSIVQRSITLFLLGLTLNTIGIGPKLETIRIFGVLQRFSITYFTITTLVTLLMLQTKTKIGLFSDVISIALIWVLMIFVVAGHLYLIFCYPVPGCPKGYLGPGGQHYNGLYKNCVGGFTGYFDIIVLGVKHIYQHPTSDGIYQSGPFDPEGLFGSLLASFQVFLGVQAGVIIIVYQDWMQRIKRFLMWGTILGIISLVLCQARQDGGWIPINKNLWSLSFVMATSSLAFFLLCFLYYFIDHVSCWNGSPFIYPGMNAILLYVGHELCSDLFPWRWKFGLMNTHTIATIESCWGSLLWILISYWLYKKKFFLSL